MSLETNRMLRHFIATLSYRGRIVLSDLPTHVATFRPTEAVRTPLEILIHINQVLNFAFSQIAVDEITQSPVSDWPAEVARFFELLQILDGELEERAKLKEEFAMRLLQGPLADAMLHLGQIGIFRRMAGSPVGPENYFQAPIEIGKLTINR